MGKLTQIGLEKGSSKELCEKMNELLANYQLFYQNLRGFHWNIKGPQFFALHVKFEEMYNDAQEKIDMIAERILTLGSTPLHTFSDYIKHSSIKEACNVSSDNETVSTAVENMNQLLEMERVIAEMATENGDEGTLSMITDDVTEKEKTIWMLNSFLGK